MAAARDLTLGLVLLLGVLGGVAGLYYRAQANEKDATIQARADTLTTLRDSVSGLEEVLSAEIERAARDSARIDSLESVAAALDDSLRTVAVRASARAVEAGFDLRATIDSVRVILPPEHEPLADSLEAQAERRDEERVAQVRAVEGQRDTWKRRAELRDSMVSVVRRRESAKDSLLALRDSLIQAQERQIADLIAELNPPWWESALEDLPKLAGAAATGAGAVCLFVGCGG